MSEVQESERSLESLAADGRREYRTVEEMTLGVLRSAILAGVLAPGERLSQDRIAEALNVSRMPVRAALRQLEGEGLVVFQAHRGALVRVLTPEEMAEIYSLRILLESFAIRQVVERITESDIENLRMMQNVMEAESNPDRWIDAREKFYRALYELSGMARTVDLIMRLRSEVGRYWLRRRIAEVSDHRHGDLLDHVERRDTDSAIAWIELHLQAVSDELRSFMERQTARSQTP